MVTNVNANATTNDENTNAKKDGGGAAVRRCGGRSGAKGNKADFLQCPVLVRYTVQRVHARVGNGMEQFAQCANAALTNNNKGWLKNEREKKR